jgi:serine O-acetyltransferase
MSAQPKLFKYDLAKFHRIRLGEGRHSPLKRALAALGSFELHCVAAFRFDQLSSRWFKKNLVLGLLPRIASKIFTFLVHLFHHVYIEPYASIGPGFFIAHASGIMIGGKIGKNCTVLHNVTIGWGMSAEGGGSALPEIGDNAWIGAGAILSGGMKIGDDVTISSGTVLSKSVSDRCLVAGNPGRVIQQEFENPDQKKFSL